MYDWIAANWIWLLLGIGIAWFLFRRGGMGSHSHGPEPFREGQDDSHAGHVAGAGAAHDVAAPAPAPPHRRHGCC